MLQGEQLCRAHVPQSTRKAALRSACRFSRRAPELPDVPEHPLRNSSPGGLRNTTGGPCPALFLSALRPQLLKVWKLLRRTPSCNAVFPKSLREAALRKVRRALFLRRTAELPGLCLRSSRRTGPRCRCISGTDAIKLFYPVRNGYPVYSEAVQEVNWLL